MKLPDRLDLTRLSLHSALRLMPALAWGLALVLSAWVGTELFWRFSTPPAPGLPLASPADPMAAAEAVSGRHMMGMAAEQAPAAIPIARVTVHAVVTGSQGRPGWAVLSLDGGPQEGFVEGQEIRPGLALAAVRGSGVDIARAGTRQSLPLNERASGDAAPGASLAPAPSLIQSAPPTSQNYGESGASDMSQRLIPAGIQVQPPPPSQ